MNGSPAADRHDWGELLLEVRARERGSADFFAYFADFFDASYPDLCRFFRSYGLIDADAEDLATDVELKVYLKLDTFQGDGSASKARAWVYKIAYNTLIDFVRRPKLPCSGKAMEVAAPDAPPPGECLEKIEYARWLLSQLGDEDRQLLELRFLHGLTLQEIADFKEWTLSRVDRRIKKALRILRGDDDNLEQS